VHIGIVCYASVGGSGIVATELGKALAARGHQVHFISTETPFRLGEFQAGLFFHQVLTPTYPLFREPQYLLALANTIAHVAEERRLDIVHAHYAVPHATAAYLAEQMLAASTGAPVPRTVTTLHGTDITLVGRDESYLPITKFGIEVSDGVTAVSEWLKQETAANFQTDKHIDVIPNFVDPARFRREPSAICNMFASPGDKLVCHVSNFRPVKRVMDVVETFAAIAVKVPSRLLMLGDGPDRSKAEAFARAHGLRDRVFFLGNVPNLEEILGACDLFLLPSESESFGMAALEAMASEVPVIATRTGGLPEVVTDGDAGYLLPVGDVTGMAERGIEILRDDELRKRMGKRAREIAVENFDEEKIVPRYRELYERTT
jgi:N-acetyl-alpha-D-glucosaminyl L-malate synthase BshA